MDDTPDSRSTVAPASDGTTGVYGITVAAELAGMSVQALRLYERYGFRQRTARMLHIRPGDPL